MPRTPTLENPFSEQKHRSADDPKFVGKILGPEAEAAMRKMVPSPSRRGQGEVGADDFVLTPDEQAQAEKEREQRKAPERARHELLAWAKEIGKDEAWALATFTIHPDGTLTVEGNLELPSYPVKRLPKGLTRIDGTLNLNHTKIVSLEGFPQEIGHDCYLKGTKITSLEGLSRTIVNRDLDLTDTTLTSLVGLPKKIGESLYLENVRTLTSLAGLLREIEGTLVLSGTGIVSLYGISQKIARDLHLDDTDITSLDGLPPPENIGGTIHFSSRQSALYEEAKKRGYNALVDTGFDE